MVGLLLQEKVLGVQDEASLQAEVSYVRLKKAYARLPFQESNDITSVVSVPDTIHGDSNKTGPPRVYGIDALHSKGL